ncbi:hypothetical protein [Rhizobacter fulvus]
MDALAGSHLFAVTVNDSPAKRKAQFALHRQRFARLGYDLRDLDEHGGYALHIGGLVRKLRDMRMVVAAIDGLDDLDRAGRGFVAAGGR